MSDSFVSTASHPQSISMRSMLLLAWSLVLLLTLPEIVLHGFMQMETPWMLPARIILLSTLFTLTFVSSALYPLRGLILAFLVIFTVESWFFGTVLQQSQLFLDIFGTSANGIFLGERLMRIGAVFVMMLVLWLMGLKRQDFFLNLGNLKAVAVAERWAIPRKNETWLGFGGRYAMIIVVLFLLFMVPALKPSLDNFSVGLVLFAALCALLNAFAEEFLYRSALLPQILPIFGKDKSILLVASWFGLAHFFGLPSGITGVIFTSIGGWIFAKAMVETGGMGWSLFLHFVSDFTVYLVILLAGGF